MMRFPFKTRETEDTTSHQFFWRRNVMEMIPPMVSQTLTLPEGKRFYRFAH